MEKPPNNLIQKKFGRTQNKRNFFVPYWFICFFLLLLSVMFLLSLFLFGIWWLQWIELAMAPLSC